MNTEVGVETYTFFTPLKSNAERMDWIEVMEAIEYRVQANSPSSLPISDAVRSFFEDFEFRPQSGHEFVWWLQEFERAHQGIDIVESMRENLSGKAHFKFEKGWDESKHTVAS